MVYLKSLKVHIFLEMYTNACMDQDDIWNLYLKYFSKGILFNQDDRYMRIHYYMLSNV